MGENAVAIGQQQAGLSVRASGMIAAVLLALGGGPATAQSPVPAGARKVPQEPAPADEIERLRTMLAQPGPDGRDARATAIERLLVMPLPAAHRVLQQVLGRETEPEELRLAILAALQRHLLGISSTLFGTAIPEARAEIVGGYVGVLSRFWRGAGADQAATHPLLALARTTLQKFDVSELEVALRAQLATADTGARIACLCCIADMQQLHLGHLLAEFVEVPDAVVRTAARQALRMLTFHEEEFATRAQFAAWFEKNGAVRYLDLAEQAARRVPEIARRDRAELAQMRIEAAVAVVSAYTTRTQGFDWAAISARTLVDDTAVLDACLGQLQKALAAGLPPDGPGGARQAFCRALLARWREVGPEPVARRSLLLEVAAYTARPEETELATELVTLLIAQLEAPTVEQQLAALRGLKCFPTVDTRGRILRYALAQLPAGPAARPPLETALATLGSRTPPRWYAPAPSDPDKTEWLALVRGICAADALPELRDAALTLALALDSKDQCVPEMFGVLLDLAKDTSKDVKFRSQCLIHLRGWRDQSGSADNWVAALQHLLGDPAPELRQLAAESLRVLTESVDPRKRDWISATITALRDQLRVEQNPGVLRAMVESIQVCGREPQMPARAIGELNRLLGEIGLPVPAEHQFRLEPLLQALATLGADPAAVGGQWLGACPQLLNHERRQSLRLVLQNHAAADLAPDVASADAGRAERARRAMQALIKTASIKPAKESWKSTEELQREARDVRVAFAALDPYLESMLLDEPKYRLLRLEVELAGGRYPEVVQRATSWLANGGPNLPPNGAARTAMTAAQTDRVRILAAEAQLELGKAEAAARLIAEREPDQPNDARALELQTRIGKALFLTDPVAAVDLLDRVLKATSAEDGALFRARLIDWAIHRVRHDPTSRAAVWSDIERHASLFDAQECPIELRDAFQGIRAHH